VDQPRGRADRRVLTRGAARPAATDAIHPDDLGRVRDALVRCLRDPASFFTVGYRYRRKDGNWIQLESVGRNYLAEPALRGILVSTRDVTESKLAEEELAGYRRFLEQMVEQRTAELVRANKQLRAEIEERRRTEEALRSQVRRIEMVLQTSSDGIHILDVEGRFKQTNRAFSDMTGYSPAELLSMRIQDIDTYFQREQILEEIRSRLEGGASRFETRHRRKDGTVLDVEVQTNGVRLDDKELLFCSARDVTERKRAAAALQESEERYRALFEENPFPMWVFDLDTLRFLAVNQATMDQYGYSREELLSMTVVDIRPPEDVQLLRGILEPLRADRSARTHTVRHRRKDATLIEVEVSGRGLVLAGRPCRLVTALDVTQRLRLEAQLRHSMKMEAIGRLAGGVAHDFNNVLTAILGHCELLLDGTPAGDSRRHHLEEIYRSGDRAASLTRQLLAFSRKQVLQPTVLDLNLVVRDMEQMLRRIIGEDIELTTRQAPDLGRVKADRSQIEQVIANLAVNARDAMPEGGRLTVETSELALDVDPAGVLSSSGPGPGLWVTLTVEDTGCGISEDVLPRIFEPFFTTKETGKGTGLGLSTVHGIVEQSGGRVTVDSRSGRGNPVPDLPAPLPRARRKRGRRSRRIHDGWRVRDHPPGGGRRGGEGDSPGGARRARLYGDRGGGWAERA
jgi:PAS domain S-box-containing protein